MAYSLCSLLTISDIWFMVDMVDIVDMAYDLWLMVYGLSNIDHFLLLMVNALWFTWLMILANA